VAREEDRGVVLLSIKPRFANAIMRGEKKVEFRRRLWKANVDTVVVYASSPTKKVIGYFNVSFVDLGSPRGLWNRHGGVGSIALNEYLSYYAGTTSGVAVGVGKVHRLKGVGGLRAATGLKRAPQSFAYLERSTISRLQAL
jgi:predicted transcriptional regulator